jgi:hypothetical protein
MLWTLLTIKLMSHDSLTWRLSTYNWIYAVFTSVQRYQEDTIDNCKPTYNNSYIVPHYMRSDMWKNLITYGDVFPRTVMGVQKHIFWRVLNYCFIFEIRNVAYSNITLLTHCFIVEQLLNIWNMAVSQLSTKLEDHRRDTNNYSGISLGRLQ